MLYLFKPQALLCCKILILIDRAGADDKVARRAPELFFVLDCQDLLILVDGVEYGSTLDIPASEIESMDVLKDAASTAIYGTKGANGVIIITTKRGKAGKTSVGFNAYVAFKSPANVVKPMYGEAEVQRLIDKKNYEEAAKNNWEIT